MNDFSLAALVGMIIAACLLDRLLGEVSRFHPLVGFGRIANRMEQHFNQAQVQAPTARMRGLGCWAALVLVPTVLSALLLPLLGAWSQLLFGTLVLYVVIGGRSLQEHANRVHDDLATGDLAAARTHVSWLVSRDTRQLDETGISKACIESVLENGNDALFAPLFWFCVLGPAGAILYRLANTLDAMWGYRTPRYLNFGWAAARFDDALNYIPARLTALAYALVGRTRQALQCWWAQAPNWDSPNAGPVMAAGAGALNLRLGGAADYHGATEYRGALGTGDTPSAEGISLAQQLVRNALLLWIAALSFMALATWIA